MPSEEFLLEVDKFEKQHKHAKVVRERDLPNLGRSSLGPFAVP